MARRRRGPRARGRRLRAAPAAGHDPHARVRRDHPALLMRAAALLAALLLIRAAGPPPPAAESPLPEGNEYVRRLVAKQRHREEVLDRYTYDVLATRDELDA